MRALLAASGLFFCTACAHEGAGSQSPAPVELRLSPYVGRLVTLSAQGFAPVLFDTGAGVTALTPQSAAQVGCEPFGRLVGWRMSGERVEFQRCGAIDIAFGPIASKVETYVFDLTKLLPEELPPLGGVVGLASFHNRPITLDLAAGALILETEASLKRIAATSRQASARFIRGPGGDEITVLVAVDSPDGPLWFLLDSGNLGEVLLSPLSADALQIDETKDPGANASFSISGVGVIRAAAKGADIIYDGAFNEEVMRRYRITFDLPRSRLFFSPVER